MTVQVQCSTEGFTVPVNTLEFISGTILWVTRPNQQCHSTEGHWLIRSSQGPIPPGLSH